MSLGYADRLSFREDLGGQLGAPELQDSPEEVEAKVARLAELVRAPFIEMPPAAAALPAASAVPLAAAGSCPPHYVAVSCSVLPCAHPCGVVYQPPSSRRGNL